MVVVDGRDRLIWRKKVPEHLHINITKVWALWMAVYKPLGGVL
jgi:hypothetical protein